MRLSERKIHVQANLKPSLFSGRGPTLYKVRWQDLFTDAVGLPGNDFRADVRLFPVSLAWGGPVDRFCHPHWFIRCATFSCK
jgi:hypothetical protein